MNQITFFLFALILFSCENEKSCNLNFQSTNLANDKIPVIDTNGQLSIAYCFRKVDLEGTIDINDSIYKLRSDTLIKIYVDNKVSVKAKFKTPYLSPPKMIDSTGKTIWEYVPPYDTVQMFPCYIYNCSKQIQFLQGSDAKLIAIQEAKSDDGKWYPIEKFEHSGCGNSYHKIQLYPKSFIMVPINKYKGSFETILRLKLLSDGKAFYSNEYKGQINKEQLKIRELEYSESYLK